MIVLGITRDNHDPSAAIVVDGTVVAAAEEERFTRRKHARDTPPLYAARYCLEEAGIDGKDVNAVAFPFSPDEYRKNRWKYARAHFASLPRHALKALLKAGSRWSRERRRAGALMDELGIDGARTPFVPVPHHLSHACSAFFPTGWETALALTVDAMGEFDSAGAWTCGPDGLEKVFEVLLPSSVGTMFTAFTEYLGFEPNDGEYMTMGMAAYGEASKADLGFACKLVNGMPRVDPRKVFPPSRYRKNGQRFHSDDFERFLGPPRTGDGLSEPYIHIAAAAQDLVEQTILGWLGGPLAPHLAACNGRLVMAGGVALNVRMNGLVRELPGVKELFVQPCSGDAGGSLGAALFLSSRKGDSPSPVPDAFLGPGFPRSRILSTLQARGMAFTEPSDLSDEMAKALAAGLVVARFDDRMEWGPRALGNRSILAHPGIAGTAKRVNSVIKFREEWRPFCPSVLEERAEELFGCRDESPYMTVAFKTRPGWRERIGEVVHADGTARIQTVDAQRAPGFHRLISRFEELTGLPLLLNTSLNRRGEPMACTPENALDVFSGSDLDALALGPFLVIKPR